MNFLTPVAIRVGRISWLPKYLKYIVMLDKAIHRVTRGRFGLLAIAGLPQVMLTVRGRKSGMPRTTPLLCTPYQGTFLVAGSNWGAPKLPVWVLNLRASPDAEVLYKGRQIPVHSREVTGEERERLWEVLVRGWPNYVKYAERTDRLIPIFELTPR